MKAIFVIGLLIFSCCTFAQPSIVVNVSPGNVNELKNAIIAAGDRGPEIKTVIRSGGTFKIDESGLPDIKSTITIQGYSVPIVFDGEGKSPLKLLGVDEGATLQLTNVEIAEFTLGLDGDGLIQNRGALRLTQIQIRNVSGTRFCLSHACIEAMPVILNGEGAELFLNQVSLINLSDSSNSSDSSGVFIYNKGAASVENTQVYRPPVTSITYYNLGTMRLNYTSSYSRSFTKRSLLRSTENAITEISNSIVEGFTCDGYFGVQSLGYNIFEDAECGFTAEGDQTGVTAGLLWRPVNASWSTDNKQILTHALVPVQASAAIDMVPKERCRHADLLQDNYGAVDGDGDGIRLCDAGAVELIPSTLDQGGINGLYYNPEADGHYVYILDNNANTLVLWSTFDNDGNQAWLFGLGELVGGRSLIADAYINLDGRVSLDGEIERAEAHRWGTLEVEMLNCREGFLSFKSDRPEFGSGQFNITRLASVKQLGCVD